MKITRSLIDKLLSLRAGKSLPSSALRGEWVEELLRDGVLISRSQGSRRTLIASAPEKLELALRGIDERLGGLERMRRLLTQDAEISRYEQASETGNSKLVSVRSCPGFMVNSYEPIPCRLNGQEMEVLPFEGSLLFVASWQCFSIPKDVVVVGIENMENFRLIRQQRALFSVLSANGQLLFVSRYPQSLDLRSWLQTIPNRYVHFGDFDLAGINIFLTEFRRYLGDRASFFIPSDIEQRLRGGSVERYREHYKEKQYRNLASDIPEIQELIRLIHQYHREYDQEGYICHPHYNSEPSNSDKLNTG